MSKLALLGFSCVGTALLTFAVAMPWWAKQVCEILRAFLSLPLSARSALICIFPHPPPRPSSTFMLMRRTDTRQVLS